MALQDIILSGGEYIFVIALLPSVFGGDKPALSSSLLTGFVLAIFSAVYASLDLWSSTIASAIVATTWFVLAWQQYREKLKYSRPLWQLSVCLRIFEQGKTAVLRNEGSERGSRQIAGISMSRNWRMRLEPAMLEI